MIIYFLFPLHSLLSSLLPVPSPIGSYLKLLLSLQYFHIDSFFSNWQRPLWVSKGIKFPCALLFHVCLSSRDLFIFFSVRVPLIYSYFCVIHTSVLSFYTCFFFLFQGWRNGEWTRTFMLRRMITNIGRTGENYTQWKRLSTSQVFPNYFIIKNIIAMMIQNTFVFSISL